MIVLAAMVLLLASDHPRQLPALPYVNVPQADFNNRKSRRRNRKLRALGKAIA